VICPSPSAAGREDRCGLFSFPRRCTAEACTMPDVAAICGEVFTDERGFRHVCDRRPHGDDQLCIENSGEVAGVELDKLDRLRKDRDCPVCWEPWDDGAGPGFVKRHNQSEGHLIAIQKQQQAITAENIKAHRELAEDRERLELRRAIEQAQQAELL
jgi:hypothetical protein